jgi:hypothetical protein
MGLKRGLCKKCGQRPQMKAGTDDKCRQRYGTLCTKCWTEKRDASFERRYERVETEDGVRYERRADS